jgi:multidrug efflux pump subunit AcrA (membrane-fusion protein)
MANLTSRPWQSWLIVVAAVVVGCFLVASRFRPAVIVGVVIVVTCLLIVLRMSIETFSGNRRR